MNEQRSWIKSRKKRLRILAAALACCLLFTTYPDIPAMLPVLAAGTQGGDSTVYVTAFERLPEEVREQTVPLGTEIEELTLPDTLEAFVAIAEEEDAPEDNENVPDKDKNPDDSDPKEDNTVSAAGIGSAGIGTETGGGNGGADTDTEETGGADTGAEESGGSTETGGAGTNAGTGAETGDSTDNGDSTGDGENTDENTGETPGDGENTDENTVETPGNDQNTEENTLETLTDPAPADAPEASDSADNRKTAGFSVQTGFFVMPVYASGNTEDALPVETLTGSTTDSSTYAAPADSQTEQTEQTEQSEQTEPATIENITWESDPAYDAQTEGVYVFTPVLPEGYALSEGVSLPEIRVEVEMMGQTLTPEQYAHMIAGLQDFPALLTEEDVLAAAPELAPQTYGLRRAAGRAAAGNPGTYFVTRDNEDNAGSGKKDYDLDELVRATFENHPIEATIEIPKGQLPQKSCYIAVRTYDVNWRGLGDNEAEYDKLFVNGVRVGTLTGLDYDWNTSYYRVPLSCLKEGKNTVRVEIYNCQDKSTFGSDTPKLGPSTKWNWVVAIDWMQLVCDGGSRDGVEEFFLRLKEDSTVTSREARIGVETVIRSGDPSAAYHTEYSIVDSQGFIVGSFQEKDVKSGTHDITVTMPKDSASGTYTVQGLLKNAEGAILATDSAQFEYIKETGPVFGPKLSHTLSIETLTNQDVTVTPEVVDAAGCTGITFNPASQTAKANGNYIFTVNYKSSGNPVSTTYTAEVTNIDKVKPVITYNSSTVISAETEAIAAEQLEKAWTITDNVSTREKCKVTYSVDSVDCKSAEGFKKLRQAAGSTIDIKVTAVDEAGNKGELTSAVKVAPMPPEISVPTAVQKGETTTFTLAAEVTTAVKSVTESGFVWGVMQNPTLELNQGMDENEQDVQTTNKIQVDATDIVDGVNYYCRAYVKADGVTYYSEQTGFDIGAKKHGKFTISNNGDNTFTVSRPSDSSSDVAQTVYYRTVNGSAVGGTHFKHEVGTLTFNEGQYSKDITITEHGATMAYGSKTTTKYSRDARTYQVEIYRVEGGATLGDTKRATRTMSIDDGYKVDSSIYNWQTINGPSEQTTRGDYDDDKLGWKKDKAYDAAKETVDIKTGLLSGTRDYWVNTADSLYYYLTFTAWERKGWCGYQALQITPGDSLDTSKYPDGGSLSGSRSKSYYVVQFEHDGATESDTHRDYHFPRTSGNTNQDYDSGRIIEDKYVKFDLTQAKMCVGYGGSGHKNDQWYTQNVKHHFQIQDTREPQFLGIAPMVSTKYKVGDEVIVSLVFDEVVGSASNVSLNTTWGTFSYAGGVGTNVLYFKHTVDSDDSGALTINSISGKENIKDMCNNASGSGGVSGTLSGSVDTTTPIVSITNPSLENGTAKGTVRGTNVSTLQYTWSQSSTMPVTGWMNCTSGTVATTRQTSGIWYLHVLGTYSGTGANDWTYTWFDFGTPTHPVSPPPRLPWWLKPII